MTLKSCQTLTPVQRCFTDGGHREAAMRCVAKVPTKCWGAWDVVVNICQRIIWIITYHYTALYESFIHVYAYVITVNIVVFRLLYGLTFGSFGFSFDRFLSLVVPRFSRKLEFYSLTCSCYIHFQSGGVQRINKHPQEISSETKSQGLLCGWRWRPHLCAVGFILEWCCPGLNTPKN